MVEPIPIFQLVKKAVSETPYRNVYWEYEISFKDKNNKPLITIFSDFYTPTLGNQNLFDSVNIKIPLENSFKDKQKLYDVLAELWVIEPNILSCLDIGVRDFFGTITISYFKTRYNYRVFTPINRNSDGSPLSGIQKVINLATLRYEGDDEFISRCGGNRNYPPELKPENENLRFGHEYYIEHAIRTMISNPFYESQGVRHQRTEKSYQHLKSREDELVKATIKKIKKEAEIRGINICEGITSNNIQYLLPVPTLKDFDLETVMKEIERKPESLLMMYRELSMPKSDYRKELGRDKDSMDLLGSTFKQLINFNPLEPLKSDLEALIKSEDDPLKCLEFGNAQQDSTDPNALVFEGPNEPLRSYLIHSVKVFKNSFILTFNMRKPEKTEALYRENQWLLEDAIKKLCGFNLSEVLSQEADIKYKKYSFQEEETKKEEARKFQKDHF